MTRGIMRRLALVVALAFLWSTAARAQEPVSVSMLAGGLVSMGSEADAALAPMARIEVALPLASWRLAPRIHVQADLSALPGETLSVEDPQTFRALEFRIGVSQRIHHTLYADLYAEAGFATRLPGDPAPRDKAVRWAAGGVRLGRFGRGHLALGLGADQRLDGTYRPAALISGSLALYESAALKGAAVRLVGEAILGLDVYGTSPRRDVVRVGMAVAR